MAMRMGDELNGGRQMRQPVPRQMPRHQAEAAPNWELSEIPVRRPDTAVKALIYVLASTHSFIVDTSYNKLSVHVPVPWIP